MAILSEPDRTKLRSLFTTELSRDFEPISLSKAEIKATIDAIDDWIDSNMASFNAALPQPARSELTARQKARLFFFVVNRRWEVT